MVCKNNRWLLAGVCAAVAVAVMPAFLCCQALDKGQIALPVLDAVFPHLAMALQVER